MRFVKEVMKKLELVEVVVPKVKVVERVVSPAGELEFRQKPLEEIMNVLADWYSVVFEDDSLRKMRLGGSIQRADQMEWVLDMLQATTMVRFRVEGKRVIVGRPL